MNTAKWNSIQPRFLRYRGHYKIYLSFALMFSCMLLTYWGYKVSQVGWSRPWTEQAGELGLSFMFFVGVTSYYFFWLRPRLKKSVQVFPTHVLIHDGKQVSEVMFEDVESVTMVYWSLFFFKMKDGHKHYFSSGLERVDYVWEGLKSQRPELLEGEEFEAFRLKLVQYDHHQKRKEWFFKHKVVDVFNWLILPCMFLMAAYFFQSKSITIHQEALYFFRLFMFSLLILLMTSFFFGILLKKFVFDKKIKNQMKEGSDKFRDLEFEGVILQRSKIFQVLTSCFVFAIIVKADLNFYSVTKIKETMSSYELVKGSTVVVDNRYNCTDCRFQLKDGDLVLFGKGYVGQIMARSGEVVAEVAKDTSGRMLASNNVHEVPPGHVAIKSNNGNDLLFVKLADLVGKIQK